MSIAEQFMPYLERIAFAGISARVKAVHLPRLDTADSRRGEFCAIELEDGALGLSYALLDDTLQRLYSSDLPARAVGMDAFELAQAWTRDDRVERSLGFASANAIARRLFDRAGFKPAACGDSFGGLEPATGDHVGMIGFFSPLVPRIVATGAGLTVLELKAELAGNFDGYRVSLDPSDLASCNKVMCTSTVLLNHSLESVLSHCVSASRITVLGPGAGCLPDALFAHGVTALAGSWIDNPTGVIDALASGESWSPHAFKFLLEPAAYPGLEGLLARCQT